MVQERSHRPPSPGQVNMGVTSFRGEVFVGAPLP